MQFHCDCRNHKKLYIVIHFTCQCYNITNTASNGISCAADGYEVLMSSIPTRYYLKSTYIITNKFCLLFVCLQIQWNSRAYVCACAQPASSSIAAYSYTRRIPKVSPCIHWESNNLLLSSCSASTSVSARDTKLSIEQVNIKFRNAVLTTYIMM